MILASFKILTHVGAHTHIYTHIYIYTQAITYNWLFFVVLYIFYAYTLSFVHSQFAFAHFSLVAYIIHSLDSLANLR